MVDKATEPLNPNFEGDVQELFERFDNRKPKKLYYEVMPVPLGELDSRVKITVCINLFSSIVLLFHTFNDLLYNFLELEQVSYIDNLYVETTTLIVYPPKGSNVRALINEVKKDFDVEMGLRGGSKEFRLVDISQFKITRVLQPNTPLSNLQPNKVYR